MLSEEADREPELDVTAADGVRHQIWTLSDSVRVGRLTALFDGMSALYVADGHHRSAAASRVTAARRAANPAHTGEEPYNYFLSVIFPHSQMQILPYNRVVRDLNGLEREQMLERIAVRFRVETSAHAVLLRAPRRIRYVSAGAVVPAGSGRGAHPLG